MTKRDEIIQKSTNKIIENNFKCTIVLSTGVGKSKTIIDAIKQSSYNNILITSPRTNLKTSWKKELVKWNCTNNITIENIQTCYKWGKDLIKQYDLIIADEIHLIITEEYSRLLEIAHNNEIPIVGLSATPDDDKPEKNLLYNKYCPIVFRYNTAEEDGVINTKEYFVYKYELTNDYKVDISTKTKSWSQGELDRYTYIQNVFDSSKKEVEDYYFNNDVKRQVNRLLITEGVRESYKRFFKKIVSKDIEYFKFIYWNCMEHKKLPYDLYKYMREIQGNDYAKFGMKAEYYARHSPKDIQPVFYRYIWARNERKNFLWNLNSSVHIVNKLKKEILSDDNNKLLIFSELTNQANKLSKYSIHSNNSESHNSELLAKFDNNEIRELSSCNSLTLGLNLVNPNYAIMESYNSSDVLFQQKTGRTNRLSVDKIAKIVFIVPVNTKAEEWYNKIINKLKIQPKLI